MDCTDRYRRALALLSSNNPTHETNSALFRELNESFELCDVRGADLELVNVNFKLNNTIGISNTHYVSTNKALIKRALVKELPIFQQLAYHADSFFRRVHRGENV